MRRSVLFPSLALCAAAVVFLCPAGGRAQTDPLAVSRENPVYREVFTARKPDRHVSSWYHGLYLNGMPEKVRGLYTEKQWAAEQENFLRESAEAGIDGPFTPWSMNNFGIGLLERFHRDHGMVFPAMMHTSAHSTEAIKRGAVFVHQKTVDCCD